MLRAMLAWLALTTGSTFLAAQAPDLQFSVRKKDDTVLLNKDASVITILSKSGIGDASVSLKKAEWPKDVTLRLMHTDKQPFRALEGFQLQVRGRKVSGSQRESGKFSLFVAGKDGVFPKMPTGTVEVRVKSNADTFELVFPADFFKDADKIEFSWIDFYR